MSGLWIEHNGGDCPIPDAKRGEYEIQMQDGEVSQPKYDAIMAGWAHGVGAGSDRVNIISYRIIERETQMTDTKPEEIEIAGLRGEDLAAFILMLENNSSLESIQDEFGFSHTQVKSASENVRILAKSFGGLNRLRDAVEPVPMGPSVEPKTSEISGNKAPKENAVTKIPDEVSKYPKSDRIAKTSIGLRDALFQTMEDLMAGRIEAADANAICGVSKSICETVRLEMDAERLAATTKTGREGPRMLRLGEIAD